MGLIRPATPGFIVTLVATILLAVVSFSVPYFKSVFFLKASVSVDGHSGNITFGTLGYCLELANGTTCSKPSVGYELDINSLVGNKLPIEIPQVAVKWLTYALVLHIVALVGAAGAAVFGLLAHVREASMACCSTFVSGFAAVVAMFAFIFDLVLFFVAKSRINSVGSAQIGNAIWLTLAAWLLLFFSGCFYTIGRCCISSRPRAPKGQEQNKGWFNRDTEPARPDNDYSNQMRLDAVKAEADRKARQKQTSEQGLPAFYESQPLTGHVDGDQVYLDTDHDHQAGTAASTAHKQSHSGYVQGAPGTRTIDEYYAGPTQPQTPSSTSYPPRRNPSAYSLSAHSNNAPASPSPQHQLPPQGSYGASPYEYNSPATTRSPPPSNAFATPGQYLQDPYAQQREYGHAAGGSSYHSAVTQHDQQPSAYSAYEPYAAQSPLQQQPQHYAEPSSYHDPYASYAAPQPNPYTGHPSTSPPIPQHDRAYTLGGDGYGASSVPPLQNYNSSPGGYAQPMHAQSPPPLNTNVGYAGPPLRSPVGGPRVQPGAALSPEDLPPGYEPGTSGVTGNWDKH